MYDKAEVTSACRFLKIAPTDRNPAAAGQLIIEFSSVALFISVGKMSLVLSNLAK
jgi:hypothetical protein